MKARFLWPILAGVLMSAPLAAAAATDTRTAVDMPPEKSAMMLANMRDHLQALGEIQSALASGDYDKAANLADKHLGLDAMNREGPQLAPYMPMPMRQMGMQMHRAASRFARVARDSEIDGDLKPSLAALGKVTQACVACHAAYRVK